MCGSIAGSRKEFGCELEMRVGGVKRLKVETARPPCADQSTAHVAMAGGCTSALPTTSLNAWITPYLLLSSCRP
jgi:hypothetical protein